jgi:hypothetical protein
MKIKMTDSLCIISSQESEPLCIAGAEGLRTLSWDEVEILYHRSALSPLSGLSRRGAVRGRAGVRVRDHRASARRSGAV